MQQSSNRASMSPVFCDRAKKGRVSVWPDMTRQWRRTRYGNPVAKRMGQRPTHVSFRALPLEEELCEI